MRRRGTANANRNAVLDNVKIIHRLYDPLSYEIIFLDCRDGWYLGIKFQNGNREKSFYTLFPTAGAYFSEEKSLLRFVQAFTSSSTTWSTGFAKLRPIEGLYCSTPRSVAARRATKLFNNFSKTWSPNNGPNAVQSGPLVVLRPRFGLATYSGQWSANKIAQKKLLLRKQCLKDEPHFIESVFNLKSIAFMENFIKDETFGKVLAHLRVIYFQKRGFQHAHTRLNF